MPKSLIAVALIFALSSNTALAAGDPAAGETKAYTCTGCHGIPGYKNTYPTYNVPKLGGQSAQYIVSALGSYKAGAREHGTMNLQAESLNAGDIEDIAAWCASLEREPPATAGQAVLDKSTPCHTCHGADGLGVDPMYPRLAGQYASYLAKALADYRDGRRSNPLMSGFAANLTDEDIADLADWYASKPGLKVLSH